MLGSSCLAHCCSRYGFPPPLCCHTLKCQQAAAAAGTVTGRRVRLFQPPLRLLLVHCLLGSLLWAFMLRALLPLLLPLLVLLPAPARPGHLLPMPLLACILALAARWLVGVCL